MSYQAVYYRDSDGNEPVTRAIDRLPVECQDSVDWSIGLLNSGATVCGLTPIRHIRTMRHIETTHAMRPKRTSKT